MQRSALCRSRRELSNAYLLANFGFDTAENEPSKVCRPSMSTTASPAPRSRGCRAATGPSRPASWAGSGRSRGAAPRSSEGRLLPESEGSGKLDRARSRLYRGQILQESMRWKALAEIYTMHSFAQLCNLIFCQKFAIFFLHFLQNSADLLISKI